MYPSRPSLLHGESRRGVWSHASRHARLSVRTYGVPACLRLCVGAQTPTVHVHNKSRLFVLSSKLFCGLVPVHDLSRLSPHFRPLTQQGAQSKAFLRRKFFSTLCWAARRHDVARARQSDGEEVGQSAVGAEAEPREAPASRSRKLECASSVARSRQAAATTRGATACNSTRHR